MSQVIQRCHTKKDEEEKNTPKPIKMFIRDLGPHRGVVFDARHYQYCSSPETAFRFRVAKPRIFSNRYRTDQYFIYNQGPSFNVQMEKMNHISRAVSTPNQSSRPVSLQPSTTSTRAVGPFEGPSPTYFAPMPALSGTSTTRNSRANGLPPSNPNWFNSSTASAADGSIGQYGLYQEVTDGLYFDTPNSSGGHFDLGTAGGGMPSYFDGSSSSTYHLHGSSPNTMFGSFSSSIGPPEDMDVDLSEFIHSPSSISAGTTSGLYPSVQRPNIPNNPPAPMFPTSPNPRTMDSQTVSPSMLHLNNTPRLPITSSSESLPGPYSHFHMETDSDTVQGPTNTVPESLVLPSSHKQARPKSSSKKPHRGSNSSSKWGRKALPDKAPNPQYILPNNGPKRRSEPESTAPPRSHSKRSKPKGKTPSQAQPHSYPPSEPASSSGGARAGHPPAAPSDTAADAAAATEAAGGPSPAERSAQDEFLVSSRLGGMKYSQIRQLGNFKEAESTLRGRFRTLVKPKEARVRNPQWQEIDVSLTRPMSLICIPFIAHIPPLCPACSSVSKD